MNAIVVICVAILAAFVAVAIFAGAWAVLHGNAPDPRERSRILVGDPSDRGWR